MTWTWRYEHTDGQPPTADPPPAGFPSQSEAESWVGEVWQDLLDQGVDAVTLFQDDRMVYGPMSLHPLA